MPNRTEVEQIIFARTNQMAYSALKVVHGYLVASDGFKEGKLKLVIDTLNKTIDQYETVRSMEIENAGSKKARVKTYVTKRHS